MRSLEGNFVILYNHNSIKDFKHKLIILRVFEKRNVIRRLLNMESVKTIDIFKHFILVNGTTLICSKITADQLLYQPRKSGILILPVITVARKREVIK